MLCSTQKLLDELTSVALMNGEADRVKLAPSSADKVKICLNNSTVNQRIINHVKEFTKDGGGCKKDDIRASELRSKGNNLYSRRGFEAAFKLYCSALRHASPGSEEFILCLGNRSAALFEMNKFNECIEDIDHALRNSGESIKNIRTVRLILRKAKCCVALNKIEEASRTYKDVIQLVSESSQNVENPEEVLQYKKMEIECRIGSVDTERMLENDSRLSQDVGNCSKDVSEVNVKPQLSYGENPEFPSASIALQLKKGDAVRGRYVVASRQIKRGDTLFYEKPFTFVMLPDSYVPHCHHCCKVTYNPIPCRKCSEVEYCSNECLELSEGGYHRWECGGGLILCHSIGIAHLGLRLALVGSDPSAAKQYSRVRKLMSHIDDIVPADLYQYSLTAAILVTYLGMCTEFIKYSEKDIGTLGGDILEHIGQLVCNGHAITELQDRGDEDPAGLYTEEIVRIATAIFPSASMMNHSCDSNIMNSFYNQYLVVRASRDIQQGEEVFNCYGPHYRRMNRTERQKILREQYKFVCNCDACSGVMMVDFEKLFSCSYLCPQCQGPLLASENPPSYECLHCSRLRSESYILEAESKLLKSNHFFRTGEEMLNDNNLRGAVENFYKCLQFRERALYKHNTSIRDCLDRMAKCYALMEEYEKSFECLERNLISIEEQFGDCSTELAFELFKISDVCFKLAESAQGNRSVIRKTYRYVEAARNIIDILFGKWSAKYAEVNTIRDKLLLLSK